MAIDKYIVSRSNYSIKRKHKLTKEGDIFERDYMTTTQNGSFPGDVFQFSERNFKMVRRLTPNGMRKHNFGEWLKQDVCVDNTNSGEFWTLNCISHENDTTTKKIEIKPNYGTILDFAYYGSCSELLKTSVIDILKKYPAELHVTNDNVYYFDKAHKKSWYFGISLGNDLKNAVIDDSGTTLDTIITRNNGTKLVEISNPFKIDVFTKHINKTNGTEINDLRFFCLSSDKYEIVVPNGTMTACACNWNVIYKKKGCRDGELTGCALINGSFRYTENGKDVFAVGDTNGDGMVTPEDMANVRDIINSGEYNPEGDVNKDGVIDQTDLDLIENLIAANEEIIVDKFYIYEYYKDGKYYLLTDPAYSGLSIRPTQPLIEGFFESLSGFEKLLLNRDSKPIYTCTIDYPHETETGIKTYKKNFTWPTYYGWNLDIENTSYSQYINGLLEICEFYDNGYTNNLWNMMTHDSIKNMDLTYTRANSIEDTDDYREGASRMENVIMLYGRFFDNIKESIDNIKSSNIITYNQYNNTPDYFLSDTLELSGWEVYSSVKGLDTSAGFYSLIDDVTPGEKRKTRKYTVSDTDNEFMRNLKVNSKAILSKKGTRDGIESLLSLFGLVSYDFRKTWYEGLNKKAQADFIKIYETDEENKVQDPPTEFDALSANTGNRFYDMFDYSIKEYVVVASEGEIGPKNSEFNVEKFNAMKTYLKDDGNSLAGLPCAFYETKDGSQLYLIPWFDKLQEYDGNPYFQMFGGWGKMYKKNIEKNNLTNVEEIYTTPDTITKEKETTTYFVDDFINGEYSSIQNVGEDYNYAIGTNQNNLKWKYERFDYVKSGTTFTLNSQSTGTTDASVRLMAIDSENKVLFKNGFSDGTVNYKYECTENDATIIISVKGRDDFYVVKDEFEEKTIKGLNLYDESFKYVNIVKTLSDLQTVTLNRLHGNDIFYVFDLSEYEDKYGKEPNYFTTNYFILNNVNSSYEFGGDGWENIPLYDIENGTNNGLRVLYLESIIDDSKGNAPHVGNGEYDDGEEFLEYFRKLFYHALKNEEFDENAYDCDTGELNEEIGNVGFKLDVYEDNMKCWYFTDQYAEEKTRLLKLNEPENESGEVIFDGEIDNFVQVGEYANYETTYTSKLIPNSFDIASGGTQYDEGAANSIINTKKLKIQFNGKYVLGTTFRKYLYSAILPYLKQIIPSTTILEISILGEEATLGKLEVAKAAGVTEDPVVLTRRYNAGGAC